MMFNNKWPILLTQLQLQFQLLISGSSGHNIYTPNTSLSHFSLSSPTKSEFIRAKYQMLAFVHKLPCRDDDGVTTKDLSKVRADCFTEAKSYEYGIIGL